MSIHIVCILTIHIKYFKRPTVKSGHFGRQVNSDMHLQTVEIKMSWLLMSRLIRIFTVC